jgi:hypothetical protein
MVLVLTLMKTGSRLSLTLQILEDKAPQLKVWLHVQSPSQFIRGHMIRSSWITVLPTVLSTIPAPWVAVDGTPALLTHVMLIK